MKDLKGYEEVKDRLPRFFERYEDPRVITELVSPVEKVGEAALFKASLYDGERLLATGWAYEERDTSTVNRSSWIENCETSAIGRALANLGLHGAMRPSREEMEKAGRMERKARREGAAEEFKRLVAKAEAKGTKAELAKALGGPKTLAEAAKAYAGLTDEDRALIAAIVEGGDEA